MADLFDMRVGGAGWHLTSHLIAIAALFVACFAITGYITYRDESIPVKALDKDQDADDDIKVDNVTAKSLDVSGASTLTGGIDGEIIFGGVNAAKYALFGLTTPVLARNFGAPGQAIDSVASLTVPVTQLVSSENYLAMYRYIRYLMSSGSSLTATQTTELFGTTAVASTAVTLAAGFTGPGATLVAQVLNGNVATSFTSAKATDVATAGGQRLVVFNDNVVTNALFINIELNDGSEFLQGGSKVYVSDTAGSELLELETSATQPTTLDDELIITATGTTTILKGSYLYYNCTSTAADKTVVHGCLITTGGTVAVSFSADGA